MTTILKALLEVTIYSSAIAGILLLLRMVFKKKISAKLQYAAWLLLIVRLMVPLTVESGVHFFTIKEKPAIVETVTQETQTERKPVAETPAQAVPQTAPTVLQEQTPQAKPQTNTTAPAEAAKKPEIHITWQQIVVGLWIMGMIALGAFFLRTRVRFMRKIKVTRQQPAAEMQREYDRLCEEMMLREAPMLVVCDVQSPALMGNKVLIPENLTGQALRYALYHELTHYRRKDHIMVVLMSALRCVYWFNPLVWIAFSAMQTDMEVACDAGVMERIGAEEKRGYLTTLLNMFSAHSVPAIGMAQAQSKNAAKERIEGAFRKRRTGRGMRMVSAILACLILICCFTTACQPTPEEPIVVNKNDGKLEETIEQAGSADKEENAEAIVNNIPERWTGEYTENNGGVTFTVDAPIEGAELEKYPVVEVRAADFTQEQIDAFLNYFVGDKKVFARGETKKDVERQLIDAKRGTEVDGEIVPPEPDDPYIKSLEEKLAAMPDDGRYYYDEPKLTPTEYGIMQLSAGIELGDGQDATLLIEASGNGKVASSFVYSRGNVFGERIAEMSEITLKEPSVSKEAAIKTAEEAIAQLGFSGMKLATVYKAELDAVSENGYFAGCYSTYTSAGYQMIFTRELYGMQMTDYSIEGNYSYSMGSESADYQPAYRAPWYPEMINVYVDENGIQQFSYNDYMVETELLAENVQLLDFQEASERAIKQLYYQNALSYNGHEQMKVNIERVVLGGTLINKKNELDKAMIVPAYHLFYQEEFSLTGRTDRFIGNNGVIVINAIDGSVIETRI